MSSKADTESQQRALFRRLASESDRGAAIVGCSLLELDLERLLRSRMAASASKRQVDRLFSTYAPLATFSAKIEICFAFGFIDASTYQDLEVFRKIRNRFAHDYDSLEFFDADTFRQLCTVRCTYPMGTPDYPGATEEGIKGGVLDVYPNDGQKPEKLPVTTAKAKFLIGVYILSGRIEQLCLGCGHAEPGAAPNGGPAASVDNSNASGGPPSVS